MPGVPHLPSGLGLIDLDMVFTPAMTDPIGGQSVVCEWAWPDSVQGLAIVKIYIEG